MKHGETSGASNSSHNTKSKALKVEHLKSRRAFLKGAARRCAIPAIVVYSAHKMTPPAFGRTPI